MNLPLDRVLDPRDMALAYAQLYDQRGGAVEVEIKEGKQGWGSSAVIVRTLWSAL
jgi:hypothetical protein